MHATRQPLLLLLITLAALVAAAFVRRAVAGFFPAEEPLLFSTALGSRVGGWQLAWPRMARVAAGLLLAGTALTAGRIAVRYNLSANGALLAIPLCAAASCGMFLSGDCLLYALAAWFLARAVRCYCLSFRNEYTFSHLFRGSLYLGLLPLLSVPLLPLTALLPVALLLFKRTFREGIVALSGALLPFLTACYLSWACGGSFTEPFDRTADMLAAAPRLHLFAGQPVVVLLQLLWWLSGVLCAVFVFLSNPYAFSTRARAVLTFVLWTMVGAGASFFLPGASTGLFMAAAFPASLLLPLLFMKMRPLYADLLYGSLLVLTFLRLVL